MKAEETSHFLHKIYTGQLSQGHTIHGPFGLRFITYADYIASGQPLNLVEQFLSEHVYPTYANTHTESSFTGLQTTRLREESRHFIRQAVNATDEDALIFCGSGSTSAIDKLHRKLIQRYKNEQVRPLVFIGPYEHHSNILPWREGDFNVIEIPLSTNGNVDLEFLTAELKKYHGLYPLIGSFSAASNVTGVLAPVNEITALLKKYDALSFWDYGAAAPYVEMDMNPIGESSKDAIFISTHKFVGGPGSPGILVVKKHLLEHTTPVVPAGGTVEFVTKTQRHYIENIEEREEGGTPDIIGSIRAGLAFKIKESVGVKTIENIEKKYLQTILNSLKTSENIHILGDLERPRLTILSFLIRHEEKYLHYNFTVALLNDLFGIQARGGCSCAGPYGHDLLSIDETLSQQYTNALIKGDNGVKPGWTRLSFNYFIPESEVIFILEAIKWIAVHGWKLLSVYDFNQSTGLWRHNGRREQMNLKSLDDFMQEDSRLSKKSNLNSANKRDYFLIADTIAKNALESFSAERDEDNSINNELRWFVSKQNISKKLYKEQISA